MLFDFEYDPTFQPIVIKHWLLFPYGKRTKDICVYRLNGSYFKRERYNSKVRFSMFQPIVLTTTQALRYINLSVELRS